MWHTIVISRLSIQFVSFDFSCSDQSFEKPSNLNCMSSMYWWRHEKFLISHYLLLSIWALLSAKGVQLPTFNFDESLSLIAGIFSFVSLDYWSWRCASISSDKTFDVGHDYDYNLYRIICNPNYYQYNGPYKNMDMIVLLYYDWEVRGPGFLFRVN